MIYGYARVSTSAQDLDAQRDLKEVGVGKVCQEKASGAKHNCPQLAKAIKKLGLGDVRIVTCLDRLARSTLDLLDVLDTMKRQGGGF